MAINIQSLFADIIDTPEQRQMKMYRKACLGVTGLRQVLLV